MFTGIVEEMGTVRRLNQSPNRCELELSASKVLEGTQIGDSIAVNGVCLTVIRMGSDHFTADVMPETLRRFKSESGTCHGSRRQIRRTHCCRTH